jgi:hypothetical protein
MKDRISLDLLPSHIHMHLLYSYAARANHPLHEVLNMAQVAGNYDKIPSILLLQVSYARLGHSSPHGIFKLIKLISMP